MDDKQPNENSQYRRLRRRTLRRRSEVTLERIIGFDESQAAPLIHNEQSVPGRLIDLNGKAAAIFTKTRLDMGETLSLTLTLGDESPLRTDGEVIALKRVDKHGGYLATISLHHTNREHRTTIDWFLADIEFLTAQEMKTA